MARQTATDKSPAPSAPQTAPSPKLKISNQIVVYHHLFKAMLSNMKKNMSWKPGSPDIHEVEHVHFFHSVDSNGIPQGYTNEIGGHFHAVKWGYDKEGNPIAECGPPLKRVSKRRSNGLSKIAIVPVQWVRKFFDDAEENEDGTSVERNPEPITDTHTHKMVYIKSDEINAAVIQAIQQQNVALTGTLVQKASQVKVTAPTDDGSLIDNDRAN